MNKVIRAPQLDIDKILFKKTDGIPHERCRLERRVVANLLAHLEREGFKPVSVYDGEETDRVSSMKEAMELIFNLDEAWLRVKKEGFKSNVVFLTLGNSADVVCDYGYSKDDAEGFNAVMESFEAYLYAIDFDKPFESLTTDDLFYLEEEGKKEGMEARAYFEHLKSGIEG